MYFAIYVSICVGFAFVSVIAFILTCLFLVILATYYDSNKKPDEQVEEAHISWLWAKIWVTLSLLSCMFSVFCGVYAGRL